MRPQRLGACLGLLSMLAGCGGGGGSSTPAAPPTTTPPPPPAITCTLRERQDWAGAQLREWYLFPETLPTSLDPSSFTTVEAYIDALTATARAQRRDRFFTFLTSIAEENAFFEQGASAGFGIRLATDLGQSRLFVTEAFEGAPALAAGIDRGTEILAIGTGVGNLRSVADIIAAEGAAGITAAIGPSTAGTMRVLRVTDAAGTRDLTITKADFALLPVSTRYGARIINDAGRQVGYVNLRTFILTAEPALRDAFAQFRAAGVTDIVVDMRYNGGGLIAPAELFGDLLGRDRVGQVFSRTIFRPEKASNNTAHAFLSQPQSVAPTRIAFIGTTGTASASELLINAFIPYLGNRAGLIGTNTLGKPVGQIAIDRAPCDDRLRIIAFSIRNSVGQGDYFDGLATTVGASCQAPDDFFHQMGDPQEASTRQALDFLAGRACTPVSAAPPGAQPIRLPRGQELLVPERPTAPQREVPGLF